MSNRFRVAFRENLCKKSCGQCCCWYSRRQRDRKSINSAKFRRSFPNAEQLDDHEMINGGSTKQQLHLNGACKTSKIVNENWNSKRIFLADYQKVNITHSLPDYTLILCCGNQNEKVRKQYTFKSNNYSKTERKYLASRTTYDIGKHFTINTGISKSEGNYPESDSPLLPYSKDSGIGNDVSHPSGDCQFFCEPDDISTETRTTVIPSHNNSTKHCDTVCISINITVESTL